MTGQITPIKRGSDSVRFLGNWHESIPRILFMDPFLSSHDRNVYCVIRALMSEKGVAPHREMRFPDYSEIMKYGNIGSRATVAKAITAARIIGWIVQNNPSEGMARDEISGRFKHKQWLFLDEPMPHREICEFDHGFVEFIKQATERQDEHIADLAQRVLVTLIDDHGSELDKSIYERRLTAYEAVIADPVVDQQPSFFGIPLVPVDRNSGAPSLYQEENSPGTVHELGQNLPSTEGVLGVIPPSSGDELGNLHQISAFSPSTGGELGDNDRVQEMNSVTPSSSNSSSKNTTTTTNTDVVKQRTALFDRIGFNPNSRSIYTTRFEKLPDEYQELVILEMNARMDRKLNRNNSAYLGHLLKTTRSALERDDPGLLIFTPDYSSPVPDEKQSRVTDPVSALKQELQEARADYRHWQLMQQSTATEAQRKQVNVMVDMAKTKIKKLEGQLGDTQKQSRSKP